MPAPAVSFITTCRHDCAVRDTARKAPDAPVSFAQQIAVFYPYAALATMPRPFVTSRNETCRGPEAASPCAGLARQQRDRNPR